MSITILSIFTCPNEITNSRAVQIDKLPKNRFISDSHQCSIQIHFRTFLLSSFLLFSLLNLNRFVSTIRLPSPLVKQTIIVSKLLTPLEQRDEQSRNIFFSANYKKNTETQRMATQSRRDKPQNRANAVNKICIPLHYSYLDFASPSSLGIYCIVQQKILLFCCRIDLPTAVNGINVEHDH